MLVAIVLNLISEREAVLRHHLGRANHAAGLVQIGKVDPKVAAAAHAGDGPKPLTCSSILGAALDRDGMQLKAGEQYRLRFSGLTTATSRALLEAFVARPPRVWSLDGHDFTVEEVICDARFDPQSGCTTYEEMVERRIEEARRLPTTLSMVFASPTSFRSKGVNVPFPLPDLVFGSLVDRWNAFSPDKLNAQLRETAEVHWVVSHFSLHSRPVYHKQGGVRIGSMGEVTYRALKDDFLVTAHILADYAKFAGVGVQTTTGMGQCWRLDGGA